MVPCDRINAVRIRDEQTKRFSGIGIRDNRVYFATLGARTVFADDAGESPELLAVGEIPAYAGDEFPATFGQSADANGNVYVQWHRRDNAGAVRSCGWQATKWKQTSCREQKRPLSCMAG